jgi:choline dehydrogenase-like flavoprotein
MEGGGLEVTAESQDLYRGENVGLPYLPIDACRLRYLGGSSNHWGGFTRPLDARDFGPLPQHPLNAWPIAKSDLDIYAKRTAEILDLPAAVAPRDIFGGKEEMLSPAVYRVSPVQMAGKYQDELTRSPLVSLCLNANLVDIELASDLRTVSAMVFRSYAREQQFKVAARSFALCCGGLENPRVLLNANRQIATGIGNQHDQVGRHFCEHIELVVGRAMLASPLPESEFYVATDRVMEERRCLSFSVILMPLENNVTSYAQRLAERIAQALRAPRETYFDASVAAVACQAVNPESRVLLADTRDRFGLHHLKLDWRITDIDALTVRTAALELGRALALHDVGRLHIEPWVTDSAMSIAINKDQSGSSHHMCTTRMSDDPGQGVVDRDCCVHGLDNLYIGGSSVFSSPGVSNPTFTIVQLALRLADHLDDRLRKS